jgi:hypothetical protein
MNLLSDKQQKACLGAALTEAAVNAAVVKAVTADTCSWDAAREHPQCRVFALRAVGKVGQGH